MRCAAAVAAALGAIGLARISSAQVVINEVAYDDASTDNHEYVELYNSGPAAVDISGWTLIGRDATTVNPTTTVPASTSLAAGGYYVFGNTGVLNANQTIAADFLENGPADSTEFRDSGGNLVDALVYESNGGLTGNLTGSGLPAQIGPGYFGNYGTFPDTANNTVMSLGRYVDGRDTNNNGRDFGVRPSTPGTSNHAAGLITTYNAPDPTGQTVGASVPGLTGSFVNPRFIDPTTVDANNPSAISAPSPTPGRAIVAWDPSGGGNGATSDQAFGTTQSAFKIKAYLDTTAAPQNSNGTGVHFTGSEITVYGIGGGDGLANLTDLGNNIGINGAVNGTTGVAWVYERTAISDATPATERLYLVDANDGGNSDAGGTLDWTILQSIDISGLASNWFDLGISIDALGNGIATFNGTDYLFTTSTELHSGAFNIEYRENMQDGAVGVPSWVRPPTFTTVPEPTGLGLLGLGLGGLAFRRRRSRAV
jgi:hypothetical protein